MRRNKEYNWESIRVKRFSYRIEVAQKFLIFMKMKKEFFINDLNEKIFNESLK